MPSFSTDAFATPLARNHYLRSTQDVKTQSYTVAASTIPARTIDGHTGQKVLQPGTVMAKITSGADSGKIGPYLVDALDGRQTLTNIVGLCNTFLPFQLMERDVDIAVVYEASVVQANCIELDATDAEVPLGDTTAAAMTNQKHLDIRFAD